MDKFYHSVRLDESLCKGCINCIKRCPMRPSGCRAAKPVSITNSALTAVSAYGLPPPCKAWTYDKLDVMKRYKYTVALPAPSLYSQFNNLDDVNIVSMHCCLWALTMCLRSAPLRSWSARLQGSTYREHEEQLPLISTACPSVVRLIRVRFPT